MYYSRRSEWHNVVIFVGSHLFMGVIPVTAFVVSFRSHDMNSKFETKKLERLVAWLYLLTALHTLYLLSNWYKKRRDTTDPVFADNFLLALPCCLTGWSQASLLETIER